MGSNPALSDSQSFSPPEKLTKVYRSAIFQWVALILGAALGTEVAAKHAFPRLCPGISPRPERSGRPDAGSPDTTGVSALAIHDQRITVPHARRAGNVGMGGTASIATRAAAVHFNAVMTGWYTPCS